ncbi:TylF/MycF/NovP-related O-methyltransferase [Tepidicaulis sp. LMO-SS28]|uniref:TylF/MycF/NovP-related O-methyltransferase n=1 Tax=Tepidicaulis sp. LMO-SS28 TaxID=3447455 RepID=UPI003EE3C4FF
MSEKHRFASSYDRPENTRLEEKLETYFEQSIGSTFEKLEDFPKYARRESLARFLYKAEVFQKVLDVQGSVVELGVLWGGGLMTFAKLSAIYEPLNYQRKIIGFDTFEGFTGISEKDAGGTSPHLKEGGLAIDSQADIERAIELYDENRFLNHLPKVELVKGDATKTIPRYLEENSHLVVSLLHLDVDVYEPTKSALEHLVPRMPKGAVIMFDELNTKLWPGETLAVLESFGLRNLRLQRVNYQTVASYAVLE